MITKGKDGEYMPVTQSAWELDQFVVKRAEYWWKSARQRKYIFDKFISGWVSFNIIYNFINRKYGRNINLNDRDIMSEVKRVKSTVKYLFNNNIWSYDLRNSIEALIELNAPIYYRQYPYENNWISTENIVHEIHEDIRQNKNVEALVKTYELLYRVRCNLFHGDKSDDNQRDTAVVALCWEVMKNSYPTMLKNEVLQQTE